MQDEHQTSSKQATTTTRKRKSDPPQQLELDDPGALKQSLDQFLPQWVCVQTYDAPPPPPNVKQAKSGLVKGRTDVLKRLVACKKLRPVFVQSQNLYVHALRRVYTPPSLLAMDNVARILSHHTQSAEELRALFEAYLVGHHREWEATQAMFEQDPKTVHKCYTLLVANGDDLQEATAKAEKRAEQLRAKWAEYHHQDLDSKLRKFEAMLADVQHQQGDDDVMAIGDHGGDHVIAEGGGSGDWPNV